MLLFGGDSHKLVVLDRSRAAHLGVRALERCKLLQRMSSLSDKPVLFALFVLNRAWWFSETGNN
jgi:hypothetical protein